jgi:hypothetical protein
MSNSRLQQLFANPKFEGTDAEWEQLKKVEVHTPYGSDGIVDVRCPYCTHINTHNVRGGGGHRECNGPVLSKYTLRGAPRGNYKPYDCPGYTLIVD